MTKRLALRFALSASTHAVRDKVPCVGTESTHGRGSGTEANGALGEDL
jgi:hypothetical protein